MNFVQKKKLKSVLLGLSLVVLVVLGLAERAEAFGYVYDNENFFGLSAEEVMQDHTCLTLMTYLESRGEGRDGAEAVAMVILNRVASPRFPNRVCDVISQSRVNGRGVRVYQFEPMGNPRVRQAVAQIISGDVFAGLELLESMDGHAFRSVYMHVDRITYTTLVSKGDREDWLTALHFYSPSSLERRGMRTPGWINRLEVVAVVGDHVFLN